MHAASVRGAAGRLPVRRAHVQACAHASHAHAGRPHAGVARSGDGSTEEKGSGSGEGQERIIEEGVSANDV
jgi:hypothetical protein